MVPSVAKPCAIPMPKPISCPRRLQVCVKAPRALRNSSAIPTAWSAGFSTGTGSLNTTITPSPAYRSSVLVVLDDDFADGRMVVAQQGHHVFSIGAFREPSEATQVTEQRSYLSS